MQVYAYGMVVMEMLLNSMPACMGQARVHFPGVFAAGLRHVGHGFDHGLAVAGTARQKSFPPTTSWAVFTCRCFLRAGAQHHQNKDWGERSLAVVVVDRPMRSFVVRFCQLLTVFYAEGYGSTHPSGKQARKHVPWPFAWGNTLTQRHSLLQRRSWFLIRQNGTIMYPIFQIVMPQARSWGPRWSGSPLWLPFKATKKEVSSINKWKHQKTPTSGYSLQR